MTIKELLNWAYDYLDNPKGSNDPNILLGHVLNYDQASLVARDDQAVSSQMKATFKGLVCKRKQGIPIAYLTGKREFWSLELEVNNQVLIPRHETELLVETALGKIADVPEPFILELGTGSGAISLAIASERPDAKIIAIDISFDALTVAKRNQDKHHLQNIEWIQSDWFESVSHHGKFHLILGNPPYISRLDPHLNNGDLEYEPELALVAAENGFAEIERIANGASGYLIEGGWLCLEHGHDQGSGTRKLLMGCGFQKVKTIQDLAGNDRVSEGYYS